MRSLIFGISPSDFAAEGGTTVVNAVVKDSTVLQTAEGSTGFPPTFSAAHAELPTHISNAYIDEDEEMLSLL